MTWLPRDSRKRRFEDQQQDAACASLHRHILDRHELTAIDYLQSWEFGAMCIAARRYVRGMADDFWEQPVTVHPFFRPDAPLRWELLAERIDLLLYHAKTYAWTPGDNRTKHSTTLGAAVGEMVEALG